MSNVALPVELTPDVVMEMGRKWIDTILDAAPLGEILNRHKPLEKLQHPSIEQNIVMYCTVFF